MSSSDTDPGDHRSLAATAFPTASISVLRQRSRMLADIRSFLAESGYWEVETPILSSESVIDLHLDPIVLQSPRGNLVQDATTFYLQTSPEFAMKRLLAAGSGSIYQIAHVFRQSERSSRHNPEFTLVEWYRVGGDYRELMIEVGELVSNLLRTAAPDAQTYRSAFLKGTGLDPLETSDAELASLAAGHGFVSADRDELQNFLLAALVEPRLGKHRPEFLYDYPPTQAALAEIDPGPPAVARRFELYIEGIEICNGYQELTDADELRQRNIHNNRLRNLAGKPALPVESRMLSAMNELPKCAGVALGLDRLLMVAAKAKSIDEVIAFPIERA